MASKIDPSKPVGPIAYTANVRANFAAAAAEITALQGNTTGGPFLPIRGGQMGGAITLFGTPQAGTDAVPKSYVDVTVANAIPSSASIVAGLGYVPYDAANPAPYQTDVQVTATVNLAIAGYVPLSQRGAANGVATLGATGTIPTTQLPPGLTGTLNYRGAWNPVTNTPTLATGGLSSGVASVTGDYYVASVSGTSVAIDGLTTWIAGDWINSTGTFWQRVQISSGFGSIATQNANAVAITGGSILGQSAVGLSNNDALANDTITPQTPYPDVVTDGGGRVIEAFATDGTKHFAALRVHGAATFDQPLAVVSIAVTSLTATSAGIAGDAMTGVGAQPDLVDFVTDAGGNVVEGFYADGTKRLAALSVANTLTVAGKPVGGAAVTSDAVNVRDYGALGDGAENIGYVTASGNTLSISNYTGNVTLTQQSAAAAALTIVPVVRSGVAFQPYDVGRMLYLVVGAYTLQARITFFLDSTTVYLAAAGITPQSNAAAVATWPCFQSSDVGKSLVIEGMGQPQVWTGMTAPLPDPTIPYGTQTFITTIGAVASPTQVSVGTMPFAWTARPARILWGTNDASAINAAGQTAFAAQKRKLYFSGDGALYLALGMLTTSGAYIQYITPQPVSAAAAVNGCLWVGDNARCYATDAAGLTLPHRVAQVGSDPGRIGDKRIFGRATYRRCSHLTTINHLVCGDSESIYAPQVQAQAWSQVHALRTNFERANAGKTVNFYDVGMGGATFGSIWAALVNDATQGTWGWIVPRPLAGTVAVKSFFSNVNQTASSATAPIVPDLVTVMNNGGNDVKYIDGPALHSIINTIRATAHPDGNGPTDVVLETGNHCVFSVSSIGNGSGVGVPGVGEQRWSADYSAGLIRSTALVKGFGCMDIASAVNRSCFGYDPLHRRMRSIPAITATGSPGLPIALPFRCLDYSLYFQLTGANDGAAWTAMREIAFQVSPQIGNQVMLRLGPNGNIWMATATYGNRTPTICTIAAGGTSLTVAPPTTYAGMAFQQRNWPQVYISNATPFTAGMIGQQIILPTGAGVPASAQRNFIRGIVDASNATLFHNSYSGGNFNATADLTIGGVHFMPQDADAHPDVVIFYPDGTIFGTTVAAYVSPTQATLADPAPQALTAQSVPVFVGRFGMKWRDTGLNVASLTTSGYFALDVMRDTVVFGYWPNTSGHPGPVQYADVPLERYGASFFPVITPANTQQVTISNTFIDAHWSVMPTVTPWEMLGIADASQAYYLGGVSGHPASSIVPDMLAQFFANQDLGTW